MNKQIPFLSLLLILGGSAFLPAKEAQPTKWPQEDSDIAVDPKVEFGTLKNGMRFAILRNAEPPGRVSLRLHVAAGSLNEADDQRGLAHFLEHMLFNGSRNFPDVENLLGQMQRLGIAFGSHANAYTSFDETVYMLDLPNIEEETLKLGFDVMRDFGDGALLSSEEIEKERGVILSEKRSRDSVEMRLMEQQFGFLLPDSLITHRFPIGTEKVIKEAKRDRFTSFYEDYYTPAKMTFIVVGDIDPLVYKKRIIETFSSMKNPDQPGTAPEMGTIPKGFKFQAAVFSDKEVKSDDLALGFVQAYQPTPDRVSNRIKRYPLRVANSIIGRRFDILAKKEGSPISSGSAGRFEWFNAIEFGSIDVTAVEGQWEAAVPVMEQELRRALQYGFTSTELDETKAEIINQAEQAVQRADTRQSSSLAMGLVNSINSNRVFTSPAESLRITKMAVEALTLEKCHEALKSFWKDRDLTITLTSRTAPENGTSTLAALYRKSQEVKVDPPEKKEDVTFAYTNFGEAGTVTSRREIEDLGITQLILSNNIRINLKRTDFQKNSISVHARFGNGKLTQPADKPSLDMFSTVLLNAGGLGKHSADDLKRITAGRNVGGSLGVDDDAFTMDGSTTAEDLEMQLQLLCASITDPGYREEALRQFRKMLPMMDSQLKFTMSGAMAEMQEWSRGGDGRFAKPDPEVLAKYTADDVKAWVSDEFKDSYLEVSLVGDFDIEKTVTLLLKTVGALPNRSSTKPALSKERQLKTPELPATKKFTYTSKIPQAASLVGWTIPPVREDIRELRRLNVLATILDDRLRTKLREELGATYSPQAHANASMVFNYGNLMAMSIGAPEDVEKVTGLIHEMGLELGAKGVTQDELDRALKPILSNLEKTLRNNGYWLNTVMAQSQAEPYRLDWARGRDKDYASIKLDEINDLAREHLGRENAAQIAILPEKAPEKE
ncbi:MAG: peptidase M16 [Roseibacillus sp.]|nr:peptidase M16 [Roseibacillus sp.]